MIRKALATIVLLAVVATGVVHAQGTTITEGQKALTLKGQMMGGVAADSTAHVTKMDANGNLYVREAFPAAAASIAQTIIGPVTLAYNAGDSSGSVPIDTRGLRHLKLYIKATPLNFAIPTDTNQVVRLVFQVRSHLNAQADSNSVFADYPLAEGPMFGNSATAGDTLKVGHNIEGGRNGPWSSEFVIQLMMKRSAKGSALALNGNDWYYPNGIALMLDSVLGRDFWSDYTSVRVRNIGPTAGSVQVTVHLAGSPL